MQVRKHIIRNTIRWSNIRDRWWCVSYYAIHWWNSTISIIWLWNNVLGTTDKGNGWSGAKTIWPDGAVRPAWGRSNQGRLWQWRLLRIKPHRHTIHIRSSFLCCRCGRMQNPVWIYLRGTIIRYINNTFTLYFFKVSNNTSNQTTLIIKRTFNSR
jgi:hypothetical protein